MRTSFTTLFALTSFLASSMAMPATPTISQRQTGLCSAGSPVCCDVNVLGVADLDCETAPSVPTDIPDFNSICASVGKIDMCCEISLLDQGLLCTSPDGS